MEPLEAYLEAGRIAAEALKWAAQRVAPGTKVEEICDGVKGFVEAKGARLAFPCNVDIDHVAAHYTSPLADPTVIPEGALVKVDVGVHVEGYIADTARTVCLDREYGYLVEAAEAGLEAAISTIRPGVRAGQVGSAIESAIRARGARPVENLTGHMLARYVVHAGKSIPNVPTPDHNVLEEGEVYAVEPFAVPLGARGRVVDGPPSNIYRFEKKRKVSAGARGMLRFIQGEYRSLPFASRWVLTRFPGGERAFQELVRSRCVSGYPQLIEASRAKVAQAEHTMVVTGDGCLVTTG